MTQQKDNSGALFINKNKNGNEKAPSMKGKAMIDGKEWKIAAWSRPTKEGEKMLSLVFEDDSTTPPTRTTVRVKADDDDGLPF